MFLRISFIFLLLIIACGNVFAQDNIKEDSLRRTTAPPVTITSDAIRPEILLHPTDLRVVTSEDVREQTGATRLPEALQILHPSLDIRNYGSLGGISLASFRGLPSEYTSVYWEGISITNPQHSLSDLGLVDLHSISSIGIISASNAQLIGGDIASAGIILETDAANTHTGFDIGSSWLSYNDFSSFGEKQYNISSAYNADKNFGVSAGLSTAVSDGAFPFMQQVDNRSVSVLRENNDAHLLNANLSSNYTIDESAAVKAFSYFSRSERGAPYVATIDNRGASNFLARQYDENFLLAVSFKHSPLSYFSYSLSGGYQFQFETYNDKGFTPAITDRYLNRIYSFIWKSKTQIGDWSDIYGGVDYTKNFLFSNQNSFSFGDTSIFREHYAAYLADKIKFSDNFDATVSFRTELLSDINKPQVLPAISLYYLEPASSLRLQASYGRLYHAPTFNELYWRVGGNPNLLPEYGTSLELKTGIPLVIGNDLSFDFEATYFRTSLKDQIIWQEGINNISTPLNIQSSLSYGFEIIAEMHYAFSKKYLLTIREGISLDSAKNLSNDTAYYGKELPFSTPMRSSFLLQLEHSSVGSLALTILYRGHRYKDFYNDPGTRLPAVILCDLTYSSQPIVITPFITVSAMLSVRNIANISYQEVTNYPLPGRTIRLGLDLHFL